MAAFAWIQPPARSLFVLHLLSFPCRYAFTACGASGGVYEFIKAHDASSCFYKFRHENSAHTPFSLLLPIVNFHSPPHGFLPSWRTHLTLLNLLNHVPQGLLHATAVSNRGFISVIVKGENCSHQPHIIYSRQARDL